MLLGAEAVFDVGVWVGCVKGLSGGPREEAQEGVKEGWVGFSGLEGCGEGSCLVGVCGLEFVVVA